MDKIDKYLHLLYKGDNSSEVLELKEELREHLILSANEFMSQGYTEEEAYDKAIEKFDGGKDMLNELHKTIKTAKPKNIKKHENIKLKKFSRKILRGISAICLVIVALIIFQRHKLYSTTFYVESTLDSKLNYIVSSNELYDVSKYESEINKLLKSKQFKNVVNLRIYMNPAKDYSGVTLYEYSAEYNKNNWLYTVGGPANELTSKGDEAYFKAEIEHNPFIRDNDFFRNVLVLGIMSFCVDILLLLISTVSKYKARVRGNRINMV
ncbi:permease prefix domain 1-containing protein [Intestinibacter bartlettii]|uniref:DUF1700 domain-containing protein n=1 Tax=Intestinibacter bartlettii TaxID=261299 RepID=A0ABS6DUF0_9FIRM|nr:permease prefix domain 1-containing protein [Intestinibacter bartlettii]MBU5335451.1 hypothetical protein [Intestinibacter bartlettii]